MASTTVPPTASKLIVVPQERGQIHISGDVVWFGRSMRRPHAGEALGLGFDHRSKVVAAVGALLLQVEPNRGQVFVADRLTQVRQLEQEFRPAAVVPPPEINELLSDFGSFVLCHDTSLQPLH